MQTVKQINKNWHFYSHLHITSRKIKSFQRSRYEQPSQANY